MVEVPGWGSAEWGASSWGGYALSELSIVSAVAVAENVVRVQFTLPVYLSGLLDTPDASIVSKYTLIPQTGTIGLDGTAARPVTVVSAAYAASVPPGENPLAFLDLTADRPFTPYPAAYTLACSDIFSADLTVTADASFQFPGSFREVVSPSMAPTPNRDIANPSTLEAAIAAGIPNPGSITALGCFSIDASGDYAIDSGLNALKKRLYRRAVTEPGAFLHLGNGYGLGIPSELKKLNTAAQRMRLANAAQVQFSQEPEVASVVVVANTDANDPGLVRFGVRVKTKSGQSVSFSIPFRVG